jgi:peptidyl-dipeptidase Dcp
MLSRLLLSGTIFFGLAAGIVYAETAPSDNPMLKEWKGPYGGIPPFDQVKIADFKPALLAAMTENLEEIDAIANRSEAPTFENTIVALERSGRTLQRVAALWEVWSGSLNSDEFRPIETELSPILAAHSDKITQNAKLFARIEKIYNSPEKSTLTPEQQRLVWVYWKNFTFQGAKLNAADKAKLSDINKQLAGLYTKFRNNQLADEETQALTIEKEADLAGLPKMQIDAFAAEAERRGQKGKWMVANTRSSMEPFLTYSANRALREKAFRLFTSRGDNGDAHDNNALIPQMLALRGQKAKLLGYSSYAHWKLADKMAKTPDAALGLTMKVWEPAVTRVHEDVADMQAIVDKEQGGFRIEPWDYRYYAEKVRKAKYDLDMNDVTPYLQLEKVREAMFWMAGQLYGLQFSPVSDVPVFQSDVRVFEVKDAAGAHVGLWYFDPYARPGKRSGAWMDSYRDQQTYDGAIAAIVSNNSNFIKPAPGAPVLISWEDAETMFHEFGHALHGLNSRVKYVSLSGTKVSRDFVEFPSQVHEHWLMTPEVLNKFLVNTDGKTMPPDLVTKIHRAATFNTGFSTVEALASSIVDMKIHMSNARNIDPKAFEKTTLAEIRMPKEIVMRHRLPHFGHIFSGEGYAAGYYSYLWSEVLDADAYEAFLETGNPYDPATAKRFKETVMSVGNTVDPAVAFKNFRGREPSVDALLRDHGFPVRSMP